MSTEHDCTVIRLGPITKHPDADSLSITEVDGRPCIIRTGEWAEGNLAIYVPIDSIVRTGDARFAFLASKAQSGGSYRSLPPMRCTRRATLVGAPLTTEYPATAAA